MTLHKTIETVTNRIIKRSVETRRAYLDKIEKAATQGVNRSQLACGNLAHGFAACNIGDKSKLSKDTAKNYAIISAYNDMLSAHAPYKDYPDIIKKTAYDLGAVAQFAGAVPAMCDGVTQGQAGMELSLFSRDIIAMSAAIALSHNMFDGALYLGICDKIVPGLLIGALSFGHLPSIFIPAGPMPSGLPNSEKARIRQLYAEGKADRATLLDAESKSYHSAGTCTFYGTANSNQMLMEIMGLQLPGGSFINPETDLRQGLTEYAVKQLHKITTDTVTPIGEIICEKSLVNGMIGLLATGGSTNITLHLMAIARAAGVILDWRDLSELSDIVPLLARVYPNGMADINHFQAAGGMGYLIQELISAGLFHHDAKNIMGDTMEHYTTEPFLTDGDVTFKPTTGQSLDLDILRPSTEPFSADGGVKLLTGNLGNSVIKTSAVKEEHRHITAPAIIFHSQDELEARFRKGKLNRDFVAVIRFQGPKANGMPELHKLTPFLGILQDKGYNIALITDGRMSGASGKIPAAIHLSPEALDGGNIARIQDGDIIELDAKNNLLTVNVSDDDLNARPCATHDISENEIGMGRELFSSFRKMVSSAETGASVFFNTDK